MLKCWGVLRDTSRHLVAIWGNLEQGQVYSKKWKWLHYEGIIAGYWLDGWNNFTSWDEPLKNHNCSKNLTNRGSWKLWKGATPDTRCDFLLAECSATHPFYDLRTCLLHSRVTDASILTSLSPLTVFIILFVSFVAVCPHQTNGRKGRVWKQLILNSNVLVIAMATKGQGGARVATYFHPNHVVWCLNQTANTWRSSGMLFLGVNLFSR